MGNKKLLLILAIILILPSNIVFAHPGRTDSQGGHTCKTNCEKWGYKQSEYHYHQKEAKTAPEVKTEAKDTAKDKAK